MGDGGKVYDAFLKIDNPLKVTSPDPAQEILRASYGNDRVYNERVRNQTNQSQLIQKKDITKLQSKEYDGIIWKLERGFETEYSVFDPKQIKSAALITKDNNGNIIPLSERFNEKEEDIRRSIMDKEFRLESSEWFDAEKYEKMSEKEREEYRKHLRDLDIRKQARERQREIDRNRQYRSDIVRILKKGNDRIVKLLANPTENAHVPIQLAQAVVSAETTVLSNIDKAGGSIIEEINARADSCSKNIDSEPDEENSSRLLFCRYCGFKLLDNSEFCSHCGKKVR